MPAILPQDHGHSKGAWGDFAPEPPNTIGLLPVSWQVTPQLDLLHKPIRQVLTSARVRLYLDKKEVTVCVTVF